MQQYILVPLDGSTLSEAILPHAVAVAQATKSALLLLQVLEPVFESIFGALGSVAMKVVQEAHVPVLLVRGRHTLEQTLEKER